jgi:wyosine [tRNA(Phe)-imidazoG37] synthetase (radical SAM superfamily)
MNSNYVNKQKVQELIDRMLYLNSNDLNEFIEKFDKLTKEYKPQQIEVDGVKYFRVQC